MKILLFLFEPMVFYVVLAVLFFTALFYLFLLLRQGKEAPVSSRQEIGSDVLAEKEKAYQEKISQLEGLLRSKEEELKSAASRLREVSSSAASSENLAGLQDELARLRKDLYLKDQMYEGLKGQYDELEASLVKLNQQIDEERRNRVPPK
jgi:chromosome segregation ATPase